MRDNVIEMDGQYEVKIRKGGEKGGDREGEIYFIHQRRV